MDSIEEVLFFYGLILLLGMGITFPVGIVLLIVLIRYWRRRALRYSLLAFMLLSLACMIYVLLAALGAAPHG